MVHDQADELRQLAHLARQERARGACARLIVVHGAKGGVGTTTVATNLTVALSRCGRRAVCVDADLDHGGSLAMHSQSPLGSVLDVLAGRKTAEETLTRGPTGILVLPGAWASAETAAWTSPAHDRLIEQLQGLSRHADLVVVDAGSGRGELPRRLWNAADARITLCTSEPQSVLEAYAAIKVLTDRDSGNTTIHTLVNCECDAVTGDDVHARLAKACQNFLGLRAQAAGHVASHEGGDLCDGVLIFPDRSASARALDRLAGTLMNTLSESRLRTSSQQAQGRKSPDMKQMHATASVQSLIET